MGFRHQYGRIDIEVTVKRLELIARLKKNKKKHEREFEKAIRLWQKDLEKAIQDIDLETIKQYPMELDDLHKNCPISFLSEYDDIIDMFEMAIKDEILLSAEAFRNFCRDEWDWKSEIMQNRYYKKVVHH